MNSMTADGHFGFWPQLRFLTLWGPTDKPFGANDSEIPDSAPPPHSGNHILPIILLMESPMLVFDFRNGSHTYVLAKI